MRYYIVFSFIFILNSSLWAFEISPIKCVGSPDETVLVSIQLSDVEEPLALDAFSFVIEFNDNVLSFIKTEKNNTLLNSFHMVSGKEIETGKVKVNGSLFDSPVEINEDGIFVYLQFKVKDVPDQVESVLRLTDFINDIQQAQTHSSTFTVQTYKDFEIKGIVFVENEYTGHIIVRLMNTLGLNEIEDEMQIQWTSQTESQPFTMTVPEGNYRLIAFKDINKNGNCDQGEAFEDYPGIINVSKGQSPPLISYELQQSTIDIDVFGDTFQASQYQFQSSAIISIQEMNTEIVQSSNDVLAAFVGNDCRGIASSQETPSGTRFFLQIWSNQTQKEIITFKYYNATMKTIFDIVETIEFQNDVSIGGIEEPEIFHIQQQCSPIDHWQCEISEYLYNGMLTAIVFDEKGQLTQDKCLYLAAFVNDECRGIALPQMTYRGLRYFLQIWSNLIQGETITFQLYNAESGKVYNKTQEHIVFQESQIIGNMENPFEIHVIGKKDASIPLKSGWNWLSINVDAEDMSLNSVLSSISSARKIVSQHGFSEFYDNQGWFGSLKEMNPLSMYMLKTNAPEQLTITGFYVDPSFHPIELNKGWNWIAYLPGNSLNVEVAMASIEDKGKRLVGQKGFVEYDRGWWGTLNILEPYTGYKLNMQSAHILKYPVQPKYNERKKASFMTRKRYVKEPGWNLNITTYELNETMITKVFVNNTKADNENDVLAAFAGDICRGLAYPVDTPEGKLYFLQVWGNRMDESIQFRYYDSQKNVVLHTEQTIQFQSDKEIGTIQHPESIYFDCDSNQAGAIVNTGYSLKDAIMILQKLSGMIDDNVQLKQLR
jgi:hypothetical protein